VLLAANRVGYVLVAVLICAVISELDGLARMQLPEARRLDRREVGPDRSGYIRRGEETPAQIWVPSLNDPLRDLVAHGFDVMSVALHGSLTKKQDRGVHRGKSPARRFATFFVVIGMAITSCARATDGSIGSHGGAARPAADPSSEAARTMGLATPSCEVPENEITIEAASASAGYGLLVPFDELADAASEGSIVGVWRCGGGEFEMRFRSGIVFLQEGNRIADPARAWEGLAKQDPVDTSVGTVQGHPAALIDPAKSMGGALGSVTVVIGGTIVWVVGDGLIPVTDLVRVADSLRTA